MQPLWTFLYILVFTLPLRAEDPVKQTQQFLRDADDRNAKFKTDNKARKADEAAKALGGNEENTEAIYDLAADIFGTLAKDQGGDAEKMEKFLENAQKNPEGFANSLTPEQKAKLRKIAKEIEAVKKLP